MNKLSTGFSSILLSGTETHYNKYSLKIQALNNISVCIYKNPNVWYNKVHNPIYFSRGENEKIDFTFSNVSFVNSLYVQKQYDNKHVYNQSNHYDYLRYHYYNADLINHSNNNTNDYHNPGLS